MRRFNRTPCFTGPDDPEIGQVRGVLELGETVIIETVGGADNDYEAAGETKAGMITSGQSHQRNSRPGGPFEIQGIEPTTGYLSKSSTLRWDLTASTAMAVPTGVTGAV